jgi:hypothetical protein
MAARPSQPDELPESFKPQSPKITVVMSPPPSVSAVSTPGGA